MQFVFNGCDSQQLEKPNADSSTKTQIQGAQAAGPSPSTHLQVLFNLVIHLVQGLRTVLQQEAGLQVLGFPSFVILLLHLLVGQAQGAQGLLCEGLQ